LVWVLRRESGWGLEIVLINGGTIPETYLKDKQIKNISEKTDKLILITHDKDYIKYDQTGEKNSKSLLDRKNNKDRKYLPDNFIHIRIDDSHENKWSDEALDFVLTYWNELKKKDVQEIKFDSNDIDLINQKEKYNSSTSSTSGSNFDSVESHGNTSPEAALTP